jgi:polysaccharide pyruvyl transferase WcaK-like protein
LACNELFQELQQSYPGRLFTLQSQYDEREVKHVIAQCDFFIGARMHACIAALSQCVPAAAMAYSDKFIGVLRSVGMQAAVVDLRSLSTDEVLAALGSIYDSREALKSVLRNHVPLVQQTVCDLFNDFSSDFKGLCTDANAGR